MKKILILGANAFIGRNLTEHLQEKYQIAMPTREELDLLDATAVSDFLRGSNFDVVIHSANVNKGRRAEISSYDVLDGNLRMFYNLERCADYYGKMLYFGSGAEYDMRNYIPNMKENYFGNHVPVDSYGFSKYIMSKSCIEKDNIYDLRLFGVFGKYEEYNRRFISNAICRALKGFSITINRNMYFDYLWIDDLSRIMEWFIENKPLYQHYNVCRGERVDLLSLSEMVKKALNAKCEIQIAEPGWKLEYTGNNQRMLQEMGEFEFTDLEVAVLKLCEYYRECISEIEL